MERYKIKIDARMGIPKFHCWAKADVQLYGCVKIIQIKFIMLLNNFPKIR